MSDRYEQDRSRRDEKGFDRDPNRESWRGNPNINYDDRESNGYRNETQNGSRGERPFHHEFQQRGRDLDRQNYNSMGGPNEGGQWDDQNAWSSRRGAWTGTQRNGQGMDSGRYANGGSYYGGAGDFGGGMSQYGEQGRHAGRGPKGYKRSDERIREDVNDRLTHDSWVDASEIEVQVKDGEVTLTGTVSSRDEKRRAEDAIENVSGIREVHNQLRVNHQNEESMAGQGGSATARSGSQQSSRK